MAFSAARGEHAVTSMSSQEALRRFGASTGSSPGSSGGGSGAPMRMKNGSTLGRGRDDSEGGPDAAHLGGAASPVPSVFHREVPVFLDDDRRSSLSINVRVSDGKVFELDVTDEGNPLFLCGVRITDADFHVLKREQGLRVDFTAFPAVVIELLQGCITSFEVGNSSLSSAGTSSTNMSTDEQQVLQCHLRSVETAAALVGETPGTVVGGSGRGGQAASAEDALVLGIVEPKRLRHLSHLRLVLRPASDKMLQRHLAEQLKCFRGACERVSSQLSETEEVRRSLEDKIHQYELASEQATFALKEAHARELHETEESLRAQAAAAEENHRKLDERKEQEREQAMDAMRDDLKASQREGADLRANCAELEGEIRTLSSRVQQSEAALEAARVSTDQVANGYDARLEDKEALVAKMAALLEAANRSRAELSEQLEEFKMQRSRDTEELDFQRQEVAKGNEIIVRLQARLKETGDRARVSHALAEKSSVGEELRIQELQQARAEAEQLKTDRLELQRRLEDQAAAFKAQGEEMERTRQQSEKSENVITFLNKELNAARTGIPVASAPRPAPREAFSRVVPTVSSSHVLPLRLPVETVTEGVSAYRRRPAFREQHPRPSALSGHVPDSAISGEFQDVPRAVAAPAVVETPSEDKENDSSRRVSPTQVRNKDTSTSKSTSFSRSPSGPPKLHTQARAQAREAQRANVT
jgi:Centriolar protein SAS N-terminal domain